MLSPRATQTEMTSLYRLQLQFASACAQSAGMTSPDLVEAWLSTLLSAKGQHCLICAVTDAHRKSRCASRNAKRDAIREWIVIDDLPLPTLEPTLVDRKSTT